jgi:NDP-sugar pyrophosphorylase family protein
MKAMILAAGYGTRFRPVTYTLPKPLVPLCNRPLIDWAVESLLGTAVAEIVVNLHHLPEQLEQHLVETFPNVSFHFSLEEKEILGTGGGVRRVREWLEGDEDFFLLNGDTIQFPPYEALVDARRSTDAIAALTLRHPPAGDRFTPVFLDNGSVTGFGSGGGEALMFSGSHFVSSRVFQSMPDRDVFGIVDAVYQPLIEGGHERVAGVIDDSLWFDIGSPKRYRTAMSELRSALVIGRLPLPRESAIQGDSIVAVSAALSGHIEASTIGARSTVAGTVRNSAIWEDCDVPATTRVDNCIVAHGVRLPSDFELRDSLICRDHPSIPAEAGERVGELVVAPI